MFLDCKIPMPNQNATNTIQYVEILTQAIINKEKLIRQRHQDILNSIETELTSNQKPNNFKFQFPTYHEILEVGRLDTGLYSEKFKKIDFLVKNYADGFFFIDKNRLKSGSTPDIRHIGSLDILKYRWVTPTHCSDFGVIFQDEGINLRGQNNLNQDCILLVNRTSKGGAGEYVGIASYYNFKDFQKGHHNQGLYRIINYEHTQLIFILCFLNSDFMRKYCSGLAVGSKMKELKMEQFLQIPFPNFPQAKQEAIASLYYKNLPYQISHCNLTNFLETDNAFNAQAGIYELDKTAKLLKTRLNEVIDDIICDREVEIRFEF